MTKVNFTLYRLIFLLIGFPLLVWISIFRGNDDKQEFLANNKQLLFEKSYNFQVKHIVKKDPAERHTDNFIQLSSIENDTFIIKAYPLSNSDSSIAYFVKSGSFIEKRSNADSVVIRKNNIELWYGLNKID